MMTAPGLARCTGARIDRAEENLPWIAAAMDTYGIDTPLRQAAFLANIGHESGGLHFLNEIWGPTETQRRYETRQDLGNNQPGDGVRFKGRGWLQITGRDNYRAAYQRLRAQFGEQVPDFEKFPDNLATARWAAMTAGDFWRAHNLNKWADIPDFDGVADVINRGRKTEAIGDANGYFDRKNLYEAAKAVLGA